MNQDLDKKLCEDHPEIFKNRTRSIAISPMGFGFECGDGWYDIIDIACRMIDHHIKGRPDQQKWAKDYDQEIKPDIPPLVATQVKEKFGTLRFYHNGGDEVTDAYVSMVELMSGKTCEDCGMPGKTISKNGWLRTQCSSCNDKTQSKE